MRIRFHKNFLKQYKKLRTSQQEQCDKRIVLFVENPHHPTLNNHVLHGKYQNYRSINITGDIRAIFESVNDDVVYFIALDTHSNLYE